MTPEQLLKPRYKVIADYPGNCLEVGTIIDNESAVRLQEHILCKYPHLFKKLKWWEERIESEMPESLTYRFLPESVPKIIKVKKHFSNSLGEYNPMGFMCYADDFRSYSKTTP